ncbi:PREDICTED: uncharacterized protein LOC105131499 [Populus euphratica]|uniref:Uncharacterized protein LOC105131499 n=1 Tax=Populus euphratica TaxID=75702 RepID=A0AAJ6UN47_POPEU|nr:PREDICTED: uncharacterized protein LOC105131499 [Populus euphratica]
MKELKNKPGVLYIGRIPYGFYEGEMKAYFSQDYIVISNGELSSQIELYGEASECSHGSLYLTLCFYMLQLFVHKPRPNNPRYMMTLGLFDVQAEIAYELLFYVNPVVFQIYFPRFFLVGYRNCLSPGLCTTVYARGREHHRLSFFYSQFDHYNTEPTLLFSRRLSPHYNHNFTAP